jgi:hypothetical protein
MEALRFEDAKKAGDAGKLEEYLKANPSSAYRVEAETEIQRLRFDEKAGRASTGLAPAASTGTVPAAN